VSQWSLASDSRRGGEPARLRRLVDDGRTVDVRQLAATDRVVAIALGFGDEFWRVRPGYSANPVEGRIDGGELILEDGVRIVDASRLSFLDRRIERVVYRV